MRPLPDNFCPPAAEGRAAAEHRTGRCSGCVRICSRFAPVFKRDVNPSRGFSFLPLLFKQPVYQKQNNYKTRHGVTVSAVHREDQHRQPLPGPSGGEPAPPARRAAGGDPASRTHASAQPALRGRGRKTLLAFINANHRKCQLSASNFSRFSSCQTSASII